MQWFYSKNGTQQGPVPQEELIAKLAAGEVSRTDLVWREGMMDWIPAGQVLQISASVAPVAQGPVEHNPYAAPTYPQPMMPMLAPPTSGAAIASLVCGIVSLLPCFMPFFLPAAIAAVICGHIGLGTVARSNGQTIGRGLAIGGLVTGYLSIAICVIYIIVIVVSIATSP